MFVKVLGTKKIGARSLRGLDSTWPKGDNEVERKRGKPAEKGSNDEEDADIGVLQNNVCQRDKGGRKVQPLERKEKKRPVGPGMQGCRNVGRGKREKRVNGRKIKANGTVRSSRDDKRAEGETMGSFSDSNQCFY